MFFGYNDKPQFLKEFDKLTIAHKRVNVCSRDKGECRGSLPLTQLDGTVRWTFLYSDGTTDEGIWVNSCTALVQDDTFGWIEYLPN